MRDKLLQYRLWELQQYYCGRLRDGFNLQREQLRNLRPRMLPSKCDSAVFEQYLHDWLLRFGIPKLRRQFFKRMRDQCYIRPEQLRGVQSCVSFSNRGDTGLQFRVMHNHVHSGKHLLFIK